MSHTHDPDEQAALRAERERVVRLHMEAENVHDFDRTLSTFSHPRYELIATGQVHDGEEEVRRGKSKFPVLFGGAIVSVLAGLGCFAAKDSMGPQGAFFLSGVFFLVAGLLGYRAWLGWSGARTVCAS